MSDTCHSAKQTDPHIYTDTVFHSKNTLKRVKKNPNLIIYGSINDV